MPDINVVSTMRESHNQKHHTKLEIFILDNHNKEC